MPPRAYWKGQLKLSLIAMPVMAQVLRGIDLRLGLIREGMA